MRASERPLRVLVLGGTGCVGEALVRRLGARGHHVAVFHRGGGAACAGHGALHLHGNRLQLEHYASEFAAFAPQVVVDLIAGSAPAARRTLRTLAVPGRRLIFAGSQEVYRAWSVFEGAERVGLEPEPVSEESRLRCRPPALPAVSADDDHSRGWMGEGYDKLGMERAVRAWPGATATVLRLAPVYGPGDRQHRLYPLFRRMQDGRGVILLPRGWAAWRSARGYVENMAAGFVLAVEQPRAAGRVYNLADGISYSGLEWVLAVGRAFGWRGQVMVAPPRFTPPHLRVQANTAQHCHADTRRIRVELGYREPVGLGEALAATLAWERRWSPAEPGERERTQRDYASEDAALLALGVAAGAAAGGYRTAKAANSSAITTNTQTLPSGPTAPPVIQCEP